MQRWDWRAAAGAAPITHGKAERVWEVCQVRERHTSARANQGRGMAQPILHRKELHKNTHCGQGNSGGRNIITLKIQNIKIHIYGSFSNSTMNKANNNLPPGNTQKQFFNREGGYNFKGGLKFKHLCFRTTLKSFCFSICGMKLWNGLSVEPRQCVAWARSNSGTTHSL